MRILPLGLAWFSLSAQDFRSTLAGTVTDPAGAAITGAKVKAVNTQTNAAAEVASNDSGRYAIAFSIPGKYVVTVEAPGFKQLVRQNAEPRISTSVGMDVCLEIGAITDRVTVTAQMSQLETETASRGGIVTMNCWRGSPMPAAMCITSPSPCPASTDRPLPRARMWPTMNFVFLSA